MAVTSAVITVPATANGIQLNSDAIKGRQTVKVSVPTGGQTVFVGGVGVTAAAGYPIAAGTSEEFALGPKDDLFGIVAGTTQATNVCRTGV